MGLRRCDEARLGRALRQYIEANFPDEELKRLGESITALDQKRSAIVQLSAQSVLGKMSILSLTHTHMLI